MSYAPVGWWRRTFNRLGAGGVAGSLGLVAVLLLAGWLPRLEHESAELEAALARRTAGMTRRVAPAAPIRVPLEQQVATFVGTFPPLSQHAKDLRQVFDSAHHRKLLLPKGEYQIRDEAGAPLVTVTATFPLVAKYPALRDFSADVLKALPHATLDELRMSRDGAGSEALESSVRFSFVYRRF